MRTIYFAQRDDSRGRRAIGAALVCPRLVLLMLPRSTASTPPRTRGHLDSLSLISFMFHLRVAGRAGRQGDGVSCQSQSELSLSDSVPLQIATISHFGLRAEGTPRVRYDGHRQV